MSCLKNIACFALALALLGGMAFATDGEPTLSIVSDGLSAGECRSGDKLTLTAVGEPLDYWWLATSPVSGTTNFAFGAVNPFSLSLGSPIILTMLPSPSSGSLMMTQKISVVPPGLWGVTLYNQIIVGRFVAPEDTVLTVFVSNVASIEFPVPN
ncbi:MAG: hypothetical protein RL885_11765 [Planctomycetota bacterium]